MHPFSDQPCVPFNSNEYVYRSNHNESNNEDLRPSDDLTCAADLSPSDELSPPSYEPPIDLHKVSRSMHLMMAQDIQRGMDELEAESQQLQQEGLRVEKRLRQSGLRM